MLSSALISLGVAGSALAWPSLGHSRHSSIARAIHARQEPAVKAKEPVAATWFASWHADEFSLANVSWSKYTTVSYSFAVTTPNISFVNISDPEVFKDFVSTAHANNVSATISIGGWTGSLYFSSAVATADNRTEFVKTMVSLLEDNNLDGLSFDWEYPGASGVGCNTKSVNDTDNFLLFLKELRTALPSNATISAATSITPFLSAEGTPSTNVSEFASVFDYIQLMNYDVWGPWSDTTGPNAPLNDTCATNATQKVGSAVSAVEAWTKAGFPADQLVLGVAGYGHGFAVESANALSDGILNAYSPFNKSSTPPGDAWDDAPVNGTVDVCGNPQAQGGTWNFWGLIEGGFLNENGTANTAEGIVYKYDECSQTPFVYNQTSGVFVAFDNAASFTAKGQFINTTGLRGFALWEAGGDFDDILLDAIRSGAGFPEVVEDSDDCSDDETGTTAPETTTPSNNSGNTSTNNSGSTSTSNSGSTSTSNNSGSSSTNNNSGSSSTNNSGSSSSNNSGSNSSSSTSNGSSSTSTSTSNNGSGSTSSNSGSTGSSTTTPDYGDDDDDNCEDDDEPTTVTSAASSKPTATATSEDDDECEDDDEYSEPEATTKANPTTYQAPTAVPTTTPSTSTAQSVATPEATIPDTTGDDDEDEECEDDETIIDATTSVSASATATVTSRSASAVSTGTVSATSSAASAATSSASSSDATVTSTVSESSGSLSAASSTATESAATLSSVASESSTATVTETASTSQATPSADKDFVSTSSAASSSYEPSSTASDAEPTATSVHSSSSAATTSSEPTTSARATSSFEAPASSESATSVHQTSSYSEASPEPAKTTEPSTSATPTSTHPVATISVQTTSAEPAPTPAAPVSSASSSSSAVPTSASAEPTF